MDLFADIPNEITLGIFSHLDLRGLITVRSVTQKWRALVPHTKGSPARMELLSFYDTLIASPLFFRTRLWVLENLKSSFDRQAYVNKLLKQYPFLPEEFRLWILEWPEKAVIGGLWPGLPRKKYQGDYADGIHVRAGENWLAFPEVAALMQVDELGAEYIPALLVWKNQRYATWLILDERSHQSGQVLTSGTTYAHSLAGARIETQHYVAEGLGGWITHQREIWDTMVEKEQHLGESLLEWSKSGIPSDNSMDSFLQMHTNGTMAWVRREGVEGQAYLARKLDSLRNH